MAPTVPAPAGVCIRAVRPSDLRHLAAIEDSGGAPFRDLFGDAAPPSLYAAAPSGSRRDAEPGFLLVAEVSAGGTGPVVGFVHVLVLEDAAGEHAHLEQLSVLLPDHGRRGIGSALVRAAEAEARWLGFDELTLCTYRDVPWNGPFYAGLGWVEVAEPADPTSYLTAIRRHERALGLDLCGPRTIMRTRLDRSSRPQVTHE